MFRKVNCHSGSHCKYTCTDQRKCINININSSSVFQPLWNHQCYTEESSQHNISVSVCFREKYTIFYLCAVWSVILYFICVLYGVLYYISSVCCMECYTIFYLCAVWSAIPYFICVLYGVYYILSVCFREHHMRC